MESRDEARFWPPRDRGSLSLSLSQKQSDKRRYGAESQGEREREREIVQSASTIVICF